MLAAIITCIGSRIVEGYQGAVDPHSSACDVIKPWPYVVRKMNYVSAALTGRDGAVGVR